VWETFKDLKTWMWAGMFFVSLLKLPASASAPRMVTDHSSAALLRLAASAPLEG
jgi:hypothetical protein